MENQIVWTNFAKEELKAAYSYRLNYSIQSAENLLEKILSSIALLTKFPELGPKEPLLNDRKREYRFLVVKNYKITYYLDLPIVYIMSIFDVRQNPDKIKNID